MTALILSLLIWPYTSSAADLAITVFKLQDCPDCKLDLTNGDKVQALWKYGENYELKNEILTVTNHEANMFEPPSSDGKIELSMLNLKSLPARDLRKKWPPENGPSNCNGGLFTYSSWKHAVSSCPVLIMKGTNLKTGKIVASNYLARECFLDGNQFAKAHFDLSEMTDPMPPPQDVPSEPRQRIVRDKSHSHESN